MEKSSAAIGLHGACLFGLRKNRWCERVGSSGVTDCCRTGRRSDRNDRGIGNHISDTRKLFSCYHSENQSGVTYLSGWKCECFSSGTCKWGCAETNCCDAVGRHDIWDMHGKNDRACAWNGISERRWNDSGYGRRRWGRILQQDIRKGKDID